MASKPSFLEGIDASATGSLADDLASASTEATSVRTQSGVRSTQRQAVRRRAKQPWEQSGLSGLSGLAVLAGIGAAGYYAWRWWQQRQKQQKGSNRGQQAAASSSQPSKAKGGRSPFSFDRQGKSSKGKAQHVAPPAPKQAPIVHNPPMPAGNAKKSKELRKARKEAKEAKKAAAREQAEQADIVSKRAADSELGGKDAGPTRVTYVDFEKTADAYQRVKDYEETGKKRFD